MDIPSSPKTVGESAQIYAEIAKAMDALAGAVDAHDTAVAVNGHAVFRANGDSFLGTQLGQERLRKWMRDIQESAREIEDKAKRISSELSHLRRQSTTWKDPYGRGDFF